VSAPGPATELGQIDTTPIDELLKVQKQQEDLRQLLTKAESTKGKVSEAVYTRVSKDYQTRLDALEAEARPLRSRARQEHGRLQPLHDRLRRAVEEARLDKEELEFRKEVGELGEAQFAEKRKACQDTLEQREKSFQEADAVKQRFVGVVGPEIDPEPEPEVIEEREPDTAPRGLPAVAAPPPAAGKPAAGKPGAAAKAVAPVPAPAAGGGGGGGGKAAPAPAPAPPRGPAASAEETAFLPGAAVAARNSSDPPTEEGTVMMRFGILKAEGESGEWQLGLQTSVGRTPENEVCIPKPDVSRRHATIALTETGYIITDLKSGNGTYVNDERIDKRPLADGDRIRIGSTRFVFKTAEPE
jgi:hypothetical protein